MDKKIEILRELPKEYERIILEEYFKLYNYLYGSFILGSCRNLKFTTNESKLTSKELRNVAFKMALTVMKSTVTNFLGYYEYIDGRYILTSVTRIKMNGNQISIADIIYLDYPDYGEKSVIFKDIIKYLERFLQADSIALEIPVGYEEDFSIACDNGFNVVTEKDKYPTVLMEKELKRNRDEQNLYRQKI